MATNVTLPYFARTETTIPLHPVGMHRGSLKVFVLRLGPDGNELSLPVSKAREMRIAPITLPIPVTDLNARATWGRHASGRPPLEVDSSTCTGPRMAGFPGRSCTSRGGRRYFPCIKSELVGFLLTAREDRSEILMTSTSGKKWRSVYINRCR